MNITPKTPRRLMNELPRIERPVGLKSDLLFMLIVDKRAAFQRRGVPILFQNRTRGEYGVQYDVRNAALSRPTKAHW